MTEDLEELIKGIGILVVSIIIFYIIGDSFGWFDWVMPTLKLIGKIIIGILILGIIAGIGYLIYYKKNKPKIDKERGERRKEEARRNEDRKREEARKKKEENKEREIETRIILTKVKKQRKNYLEDLDDEAKEYKIKKWEKEIKENLESGLKEKDVLDFMVGSEKNDIKKVNSLSHNEQLKLINAVGHICENSACRNKDSLSVHHITKRAEGGNNKLNNLIVLCRNHHHQADRGGISKGELKYWINKPKRFKYKINWNY